MFIYVLIILYSVSLLFQFQQQKARVQWLLQQWMIHRLQNSLGPLTIFQNFLKESFLMFSV